MTRALGMVLAGLTLLAPIPSTARAQTKWREEVTAQLDHAAKRLTEAGYTRTHIYDGSLDQDTSESLTLPLRTGREYALVGLCDADCGSLDIRLYGGSDQEIASGSEKDGVIVIKFAPTRDGKYRLKISMAKCESSPCLYGIGLFVK